MADVRVRRVEFEGPAAAGVPIPIRVGVNNNETAAFSWEEKTCNTGGEYGHKTDVTLVIRDAAGEKVFDETVRECVPRNRVGQMLGANAAVEFDPELPAGEYTVEATVSVIKEERTHSSTPRSLTVEEDSSALPGGDDPGGSNPFGGGGDDQSDDGGNNPFGGSGDALGLPNSKVVLALVALLAIAWLANSASNTAEAFT
ncbi:hypothetical protein ACFQFH_20100 [Halobaculum halobium]|uniref:Uncharacterized protein n=1 Tax=Halobaculum halobium TaxID=3032281 RepID=A0ABD5TFX1_9EURY|nr:hypothetical protein [Halobaculum sp. SYNS20]